MDGQTSPDWQLMAPTHGKVNTLKLLKMTTSPTQSFKRELSLTSKFVLEDNELYYQGRGKFQKVLFTPEKKRKAFEEAHIISEDRHHGIRATGVNITKSYYWPGITVHARQWVKECKKCQKDRLAELAAQNAKSQVKARKPKRKKALVHETDSPSEPKRERLLEPWEDQPLAPQGQREPSPAPEVELLSPAPVAPVAQARGLFHLIGLQLVGPMKQTARGARFIFVVVDHFTRWVEAAPMKTCSPEETAEQLLKLVHRFGFPERIVSTQCSGFIQQLNQILRMQTTLQCDLVAEYHPQAHGLLEETNAFVKRLLTLVVKRSVANWDLQLPKILLLQKQMENDSEEEASVSEGELESSASSESLFPAPLPTACSELPPDEASEMVTVAILSMEDMCLYCNQLIDMGNSEVFTMLQCDQCQGWAHQTCVKQWSRNEDWKTRFQCDICFPGREPSSAPE